MERCKDRWIVSQEGQLMANFECTRELGHKGMHMAIVSKNPMYFSALDNREIRAAWADEEIPTPCLNLASDANN